MDPAHPEELGRGLEEPPRLLPEVQGGELQAEGGKAGLQGVQEGLRHPAKPHLPKPPLRRLQGGEKPFRGGLLPLQGPVQGGEVAAVGLPHEALHPLSPLPHLPGDGNAGLGQGEVAHEVLEGLQKPPPGHLPGVAPGEGGDLGGDEGVAVPVAADPAPKAHGAFQAGPSPVDPLQGGLEARHHPGHGLPQGGGQVVKPPLDLVLHRGAGLAHLLRAVEEGHPGGEPFPIPRLQLPLQGLEVVAQGAAPGLRGVGGEGEEELQAVQVGLGLLQGKPPLLKRLGQGQEALGPGAFQGLGLGP